MDILSGFVGTKPLGNVCKLEKVMCKNNVHYFYNHSRKCACGKKTLGQGD